MGPKPLPTTCQSGCGRRYGLRWHGQASYDKSSCAKALIKAYLIDLTLPAAGTVCR